MKLERKHRRKPKLSVRKWKFIQARHGVDDERDLGAGKAFTLTQGIARGLESPALSAVLLTILKIYQGRLPLYFDAYF